MTTTTGKTCEYAGVRFSPQYVCGVQGGRVYSVIPHDEVQRITLHHGALSAHPLIQLIVGAVLAGCGIPVVIYLIEWVKSGGFTFFEGAILTFPVAGAIMLFTALRRGYYLIVEKQRGRMKLAFTSKAKSPAIRSLLEEAQSLVSYPIAIDAGIPR